MQRQYLDLGQLCRGKLTVSSLHQVLCSILSNRPACRQRSGESREVRLQTVQLPAAGGPQREQGHVPAF